MVNRRRGYSAIELLFALTIVGAILLFTVGFSNSFINQTPGQVVSQQAYNYSQAVVSYITTHQNLLRQLLSSNGATNGSVATLSTQVLVNQGFINNNLYYKNKLGQSPCTIIWYDNHQLQSFIYYRDNNNSKKLDEKQLAYGLNHMGAMMGLYSDGSVISAGKDWNMDNAFVNNMFIAQGTADISRGTNPSLYACSDSQIANKSYVVNVTSLLTINNTLPKDDTIHQYPDALHDVDDSQSNNRMNADLIMDYTNELGVRTKSNVIFQLNPNCPMIPFESATMQDYDPNVNGNLYWDRPNNKGCKNRQLAIRSESDPINPNSGQQVMMVTGFQRGGDSTLWQKTDITGRTYDARPYVGEVKAASLQPVTEKKVGDKCDPREVGTMAKQMRSPDPDDINNIYVGQVICMKAPMCDSSISEYCYLPVQSVTINYRPNTVGFTCPVGTFVDTASIETTEAPQPPACHAKDCFYQPFDCHFKLPRYENDPAGYVMSNRLSSQYASIYKSVTTDRTLWISDCGTDYCHYGCRATGEGPSWPTQGTIKSVNCTNDPSKAPIVINVN